MTTNTQLKTIIEYIINDEMDKARELLPEYIVEQSRNIYGNLIQEDEDATKEIEDSMEEIENEETFGDENDTEEFQVDSEEDGFETDSDEDMDDFETIEDESEIEEIEDRVEDLEDELARLKAEFEQMLNGDDSEDMEDDMSVEDKLTEAEGCDKIDEDADDVEEMKFEDIEVDDENYSKIEEEFDDLDESFNLEAVKTHNTDGMFSNGKSLTQQNKSVVSGKQITKDAGFTFKKGKQDEVSKIEVKKLPASKNPNKLVPVKVEQPVQPKGNKVSPISGRK
jgi:hypothetical protein